jgi:hypothetical protein
MNLVRRISADAMLMQGVASLGCGSNTPFGLRRHFF